MALAEASPVINTQVVEIKPRIHPRACSSGERQPSVNIGENSFSMEQEVESLVPVSNGYLY